MNDSAASLDRLHDIELPPEIAWWPLAPGWYVVAGFVFLVLLILGSRIWRRWRANAYRRVALHELALAKDAASIAELLRRTALATAARPVIAGKIGVDWLDCLSEQFSDPMPENVREQLTVGVYHCENSGDLPALRSYAERWIIGHQPFPSVDTSPDEEKIRT